MVRATKFLVVAAVLFLGVMVASGVASATTYSGVAYCNESAVAGNTPTAGSALTTAEAAGTLCATFSTTAIDFTTADYTLNGWLNSNGAASGITYPSSLYPGTSSMDNTLWVFTGTANFTTGQTFNVAHDDGTEMYVNGVNVLNVPGATPPITSTFTYTGATGNFSFEFIYSECCGSPAVYQTTLVPPTSATPEPSAFLLLGAGLLGILGLKRRVPAL